jgi:hypothetical protein
VARSVWRARARSAAFSTHRVVPAINAKRSPYVARRAHVSVAAKPMSSAAPTKPATLVVSAFLLAHANSVGWKGSRVVPASLPAPMARPAWGEPARISDGARWSPSGDALRRDRRVGADEPGIVIQRRGRPWTTRPSMG